MKGYNFDYAFSQNSFNSKYPNVDTLTAEMSKVLMTIFDDRISEIVTYVKLKDNFYDNDSTYSAIANNGFCYYNPFQYYSSPIAEYFHEEIEKFMVEKTVNGRIYTSEVWTTHKRFLDKLQFKNTYKETIGSILLPFQTVDTYQFTYRCAIVFFLSLCKVWMDSSLLEKSDYVERCQFYDSLIYPLCVDIIQALMVIQLQEYDAYQPSGKNCDIDEFKYDVLCKLDDTVCDLLYSMKDGERSYPLETGLSGGLYEYFVEDLSAEKYQNAYLNPHI